MGLGKTIEMIACMLANARKSAQSSLIVCPVSCVYHWKKEIEQKTKGDTFKAIHIYHGATKERDPKKLQNYDVVVP